ncbi:MAG TPA: hypothetical protein VF411_12120, partial [Bacteroidia bacterium]
MATVKKKGIRISKSPKKFDPYLSSSDDRLQEIEPISGLPWGEVLGLSTVNISDWHNKRLFWDTPTTGLFAKYSSAATSTSVVKGLVKTFITDFRTFADPLLNLIAASPKASNIDEKAFNLVLNINRKHPTHTHTKIADQCFTKWAGEGGGNMKASS